MGPKKGPDGKLGMTLPMDDKKLRASPPRTSANAPYGIFKKGSEFIGKTVAISGENLTGAQMAAIFAECWARKCATTACRTKSTRVRFPRRPTIWATCFSSNAISKSTSPGYASPSFARSLNPSLQDFKMVGDAKQRRLSTGGHRSERLTGCANFWAILKFV